MCASSSTTRTLKLKPAIPSIHHHPVIRMWSGRDGNVNELGLGFGSYLGAGCPSIRTRPKHQLQRVAHETEPLPDRLLQVAPVGKVEEADIVDEHDHRRRLGCRLGGITEPEATPLVAWRWVLDEGLTQDTIELVGRDLDATLAHNLEGRRDHRSDPLLGFRGHRHDGREGSELEG